MNALNNKRYLGSISKTVAASAVLCMCLTVGAQELQTVQPAAEKTVEVQTAIMATDEIKVEMSTAQEVKPEGIVGLASFYAAKFNGKRTASGEKFSSKVLTAAHLTLPFGTLLRVTNLQNMKSVIVRVNDRGPHVRGRIVDLSRAAAELIGMRHTGTARVELEILAK